MTDDLIGLKENVLLGHLIPAGTGFRKYQDIRVKTLVSPEELEESMMDDEYYGDAELEAQQMADAGFGGEMGATEGGEGAPQVEIRDVIVGETPAETSTEGTAGL